MAETLARVISVTSSAVVRGPEGRDAALVAGGMGLGRMIGMLEASIGSALEMLTIAYPTRLQTASSWATVAPSGRSKLNLCNSVAASV